MSGRSCVPLAPQDTDPPAATQLLLTHCVFPVPSCLSQSQISTLRLLPITGVAQHEYSTDVVLDAMMAHRVAALSLSGFIFFGSATAISERINEVRQWGTGGSVGSSGWKMVQGPNP